MSERRFKSQIADVLNEELPDAGGTLEKWLAPTTESKIEQIPVEEIHERSWRSEVDTTDPTYRGLKASIRASGVLQPLLLRPRAEGGFEVVSGARRLRAARDTAQSTVPAVVRELSDVQALVGGSWDAVLRSGLTPYEARDLIERLVEAGMAEGEASALVGTAPVREGEESHESTGIVGSAPPVLDTTPAADPVVGEGAAAATLDVEAVTTTEPVETEDSVATEAPAEPELDVEELGGWPAPDEASTETAPTTAPEPLPIDPVEFPVSAPVDHNGSAAVVVEEPAAEEAEAVAEPEAEAEVAAAPEPEVAEETAVEAEAEAEVVAAPEPEVAEEPEAEAEVAHAPEPEAAEEPEAEAEVAAAPEPEVVEEPEVEAEVAAAPEPEVAEEPEAEAEVAAEPEADVVAAPEPAEEAAAEAAPEAPAAVEPEPEPAAATPHVITIKLPEPPAPQAAEEDTAEPDSLPVAAPAATADIPTDGSRLLNEPVPAVPMQSSTPRSAAVPGVLRRGPLFYAVLGIGLAVGAIVFILVTVLEGVGSGTGPIIAAVVVAVIGFVTAMVSLAQHRRLR